MTRPKKGEPGHELAVKRQRETMLKKYGSEEAVRRHFIEMGRKGGKAKGIKKGFALSNALAKSAGAKAGEKSKRGHKLIKEDEYTRWYKRRDTGEIVKYVYDIAKDKYVLDDTKTIAEEIENETWI